MIMYVAIIIITFLLEPTTNVCPVHEDMEMMNGAM